MYSHWRPQLREIIDVKKWEINLEAGRYIRSHKEV
jgi:hypothetical protein